MPKKPSLSLLAAILVGCFAQNQARAQEGERSNRAWQDYRHVISMPSCKLVLLGEWRPADRDRWKQTLGAGGIFEYNFALIDRETYASTIQGMLNDDFGGFEQWVTQFSGAHGARWIALGTDNRPIAFGSKALGAKEFEALLEQNGALSPQKALRAFLQSHPGHLDARSDYLREVRRRALARLAAGQTADDGYGKTGKAPDKTDGAQDKDLSPEADLLTWAILASETDKAFSGPWVGMELDFFRPDLPQPEKRSPLLRAAFKRHIPKVEAAIRQQPGNDAVWDIWAWMARCLPDYKWEKFVKTLDDFSRPTPKVSAWLIEDAKSKQDWDTVLELADGAKKYVSYRTGQNAEWAPRGLQRGFATGQFIKDYPAKSAYAPQLEALLRLGRVGEANDVFDAMIRLVGSLSFGSNIAAIAAGAARAAGMEDVAKVWERGELLTKGPYGPPYIVRPCFLVSADDDDDYYKEFKARANDLPNKIYVQPFIIIESIGITLDMMGWKAEDGNRWALILEDGRAVAQGASIPDADYMQGLLDKHKIKGNIELGRRYITEHPDQYGFMLDFAFQLIEQKNKSTANDINGADGAERAPLSDEQDLLLWGEAAGLLGKVLANAPHLLVYPPSIGKDERQAALPGRSALLKALSARYLANIEGHIESAPSSERLWGQWLFWRAAEGAGRPVAPVVERAAPSPFAPPGTVPPTFVLDQYYEECLRTGAWQKIAELLEPAWEREMLRLDAPGAEGSDYKARPAFGDHVGAPLIEALLRLGKAAEANGAFSAWTDRGGAFSDLAKLIDLAKELGSERMAREWERKAGGGR
jgi:hypothetical protein